MPNLQKAESLLIALHHEMEAGHGDDNKADAIRDEFDAPFYALSEGGRKQINDLSGNLYLLSTIDSYIPKPCHVDWPRIQPEDFSSLLENDSVEQALDFLQQIPIGPEPNPTAKKMTLREALQVARNGNIANYYVNSTAFYFGHSNSC